MDYKKSNIAVIGHSSNKKVLYDQIKEFSKDSTQSNIEKLLDENYGINKESLMKLYISIEQIIRPIVDSLIAAGLTFEEIRKLLEISKKSRPILSKTIILKKSSKKPYKIKRFKRFKNHR